MKIVVYGVASPDEARQLEAAGADVIGLQCGRRSARRVLDPESARGVASTLTTAQICVEARSESPLDPALASSLGARWVQVPWNDPAPDRWRARLADEGIGWVLGRVPADEDDDPHWVANRWIDYGKPGPEWVQVEIFPGLVDGWPLLLEPSPDEVDAGDLDRMAAERPLVFSLPLTVGRVVAVRAMFPHADGFALTLDGSADEVLAAANVTLADAVRLVSALRD